MLDEKGKRRAHLEEVDGGGIDVVDRGQVDDDEVQGTPLGGRYLLGTPLILVEGVLHRVDIREVQRSVHTQ